LRMKLILVLLFILPFGFSYSQSLDLHVLHLSVNQNVVFVPLSGDYDFEKIKDSICSNLKDSLKNQQINLSLNRRKTLLNDLSILETDTMYLYNYETNTIKNICISDLAMFAILDSDFNHLDLYNIGFKIDDNSRKDLGNIFKVLVYIGKSNPFNLNRMKPFVWKKIKSKDFPFSKMDTIQKFDGDLKELRFHYYKSDYYEYYVVNDLYSEYVLIFDFQGNKINEVSFYFTESCPNAVVSENILSQQFVGSIFKDKPELILGFEDCSYECSHLIFTNPLYGDIIAK
jgi:hypothetical protein